MYPKGIDEEIELPESVNRLLEDYQSAKQAKAEAISKVKKIENQIKAMLGEYERGVTKEHVVTWRNVQTNRFDKRAFEKDHPELLKKYTKIDSYRRFSFK
jgi:predicted phage-related endonuclease